MAKILIVDDSAASRVQVRRILHKGSYEVVEAESGQEALDVMAENPDIRLVISDFHMPDMDGLALCRKMKETAPERKVLILMLSSEDAKGKEGLGKDVGVIAWITKPLPGPGTLTLLRALLK